MARKRLIKGANAARVEERIARVPADVGSSGAAPESSIFGALRAMESGGDDVPASPPVTAQKRAEARAPRNRKGARPQATRAAADRPVSEKPEPKTTAGRSAQPKAPPAAEKAVANATPDKAPASGHGPSRLSPSDFSAAEREAIVKCCSDYRNRLPTYLLAVQREVKVIDSVIEKCQATKRGSGKA